MTTPQTCWCTWTSHHMVALLNSGYILKLDKININSIKIWFIQKVITFQLKSLCVARDIIIKPPHLVMVVTLANQTEAWTTFLSSSVKYSLENKRRAPCHSRISGACGRWETKTIYWSFLQNLCSLINRLWLLSIPYSTVNTACVYIRLMYVKFCIITTRSSPDNPVS